MKDHLYKILISIILPAVLHAVLSIIWIHHVDHENGVDSDQLASLEAS